MTRPPRIHVPDGFFHLILRGNNRQDIFLDDRDRLRWEVCVARGLERTGVRLHAFCWMSNHVHLLAQPAAVPAGDFVRHAATHYARWFNRRWERTGHLFERRHRAILVSDDPYLLQLVRYIHHNPLASGLCRNADEYRWSSHRHYMGLERTPWLTTSFVLGCFGASSARATQAYRRFMDVTGSEPDTTRGEEAATPSMPGEPAAESCGRPPDRSADPGPAGSGPEIDAAAVIERLCRSHGLTTVELGQMRTHAASRLRGQIAAEAYRRCGVSISEIARLLGRDQSVISRAIRRRTRR